MSKPYNSLLLPADTSGCCFYRMMAPYLMLQAVLKLQEANISVLRRFIGDANYFNDVNMVMVQRQVSDSQEMYINRFLHPLSKRNGMWLIYNIDDVIHKDDIPKYNKAWKVYQHDKLMDNIQKILDNSDFILTTTEYIKNYYYTKFNIPLENILVIPNYIPHWWMGGYYDINKTMSLYDKHKKKPRIGIISSSPHYDVENNNNGIDDISHIEQFIRSTVDKYQWVFMGTTPPSLKDLHEKNKIEVNPGCDIMTYPYALSKQNLNAIVAPLCNNVFNKSKSNIKLIEGYAMGIPVIAQDIETYKDYTDWLFNDGNDLEKQLDKLLSDKNKYRKIVKGNYDRVDKGDKHSPNGWWLEKNIDQWTKLFKMRSKCIDIDIEYYIDSKKQKGDITGLNSEIEIIS